MRAPHMLLMLGVVAMLSMGVSSCPAKTVKPAALEAVRTDVETGTAGVATRVRYTVLVTQSPQTVSAFGFDVRFDPALLRYTGTWERGPLTQSFTQIGAQEVEPGMLRLGGFTVGEPLAEASTGTLVSLEFDVLSYAPTKLNILNPVDDMKTFALTAEALVTQGAGT